MCPRQGGHLPCPGALIKGDLPAPVYSVVPLFDLPVLPQWVLGRVREFVKQEEGDYAKEVGRKSLTTLPSRPSLPGRSALGNHVCTLRVWKPTPYAICAPAPQTPLEPQRGILWPQWAKGRKEGSATVRAWIFRRAECEDSGLHAGIAQVFLRKSYFLIFSLWEQNLLFASSNVHIQYRAQEVYTSLPCSSVAKFRQMYN